MEPVKIKYKTPLCEYLGDELTIKEMEELNLNLSKRYKKCEKGYAPVTCGSDHCGKYRCKDYK